MDIEGKQVAGEPDSSEEEERERQDMRWAENMLVIFLSQPGCYKWKVFKKPDAKFLTFWNFFAFLRNIFLKRPPSGFFVVVGVGGAGMKFTCKYSTR